MEPSRPRALAGALVAILGAPAGAQEILHHIPGTGVTASPLGDVNADGFDDFLLADPTDPPCCGPGDGRVQLLSGADGWVLREHVGDGNRLGGALAEVGDLDLDGVSDYAVAALDPYEDEVFVFSGIDGSLLLHLEDGFDTDHAFGTSIDSAGDLNADGQLDLLISDPRHGPPNSLSAYGRVQVFSGSDGSVLLELFGNNTTGGRRFSGSVVGGLDLDGDPYPDFLCQGSVSQPWPDNPLLTVFALSGQDGSELYRVQSLWFDLYDDFGQALVSLGDVDGDGRDDFAVGDRVDDSGGPRSGRVMGYSGVDGTLLWEVHGTPGDLLGSSVARIDDRDGDGSSELVVSAPARLGGSLHPGTVWILSGSDGRLLFELQSHAPEWTGYGAAVARAGDVDGDGAQDFIVTGEPYPVDPFALVYSGLQDCNGNGIEDWTESAGDGNANGVPDGCELHPTGQGYCVAKEDSRSCVPYMASVGQPSLAADEGFLLIADGLRRGVNGLVFFGFTPGERPFMGGSLCMRPPIKRTPVRNSNNGEDACTGRLIVDLNPFLDDATPVVLGQTVYAQAWYRDGQGTFGVGLSDAYEFVVGP